MSKIDSQMYRNISIHALHEESDIGEIAHGIHCIAFQSTLSMRRATHFHAKVYTAREFQSTLSMRRATRFSAAGTLQTSISIHALHEESDAVFLRSPGRR